MHRVHLDIGQENSQVPEAPNASLKTSVNESPQLFKRKILNAIEKIRDKKRKRPDIDAIHYFVKDRIQPAKVLILLKYRIISIKHHPIKLYPYRHRY